MTSHTETMKTKPFNTPDVQAILAGRKTMFREVAKMQPGEGEYYEEIVHNEFAYISISGMSGPYVGRIRQGNIIAVKESWCLKQPFDPDTYYFGYKDGWHSDNPASAKFDYKSPNKWHSPVTMPREAHRIFLEVVSVKVERLQDISYNDCLKEGIGNDLCDFCPLEKKGVYNVPGPGGCIAGCEGSHCDVAEDTLIQSFAYLHPDKWQRNEWVFVYEFRRVEKP